MKLMIGMPCYGGHMMTQCTKSLLKLQKTMDFVYETVTFDSLVPRARNAIAAKFLQSDCERLLFIDSDIIFEPWHVHAILKEDYHVICGMYPKKSIDRVILKNNYLEGKEDILENSSKLAINPMKNGVIEHNVIELLDGPTGFMCIKREVFEHLIPHVDSYQVDIQAYKGVKTMHNFFDVGVHEDRYLSEDYWFCRKCQQHGIQIFGHIKVILKHIGTFVYT